MRYKSFFALVLFATILSSGCAANRSLDQRSPSDVFLDVVFGLFEPSEFERSQNESRKAFEKKRKWQCENLSESELSELGITK
jgi:hypothetical protein